MGKQTRFKKTRSQLERKVNGDPCAICQQVELDPTACIDCEHSDGECLLKRLLDDPIELSRNMDTMMF